MSDEQTDRKYEKTITLAKLKPSDFRLWVSETEITLAVYNYYDVITGVEKDPTPTNGDNITPAVQLDLTGNTSIIPTLCKQIGTNAIHFQ